MINGVVYQSNGWRKYSMLGHDAVQVSKHSLGFRGNMAGKQVRKKVYP